ncbi:probable serine/threonine-protein kinase kinX [Orussus abietinus]|uniref:probable serine/threonine-protein kinase kinX n=1 Tax=Orussus abietinus TaxID=222816 RepID=UPI000C715EA2|nr:probable serine/threonine-protein kinase kinX [Orussus abietinus]
MSLLNVTVKKARFVGVQAQQFNTYVTLKLQNVKSTTVTVKGANPCWEQDFLFETNDVNTGLLVEVWSKGMIWDRALGYHYIPLPKVPYSNEEGCGQWVSLDSELEMRGGEVVGTKSPSGHMLLIDCRFELPFDPENTEAADLQRKLEMLNNTMDQEARAEQARRQILYNIGHSGYSEDSDYTSDLNYPVGGQGANSSASQFRTAANQLATPQRSLETSRENSYERDDHQIPPTFGGRLAAGTYGGYGGRGHSPRYDEPYPEEGPPQRYSSQTAESSEPLFYNSRPRHYKEYRRRKHTWDYEDSQDGWYSEGYDYTGTRVDETRIYSDTEYYSGTGTTTFSRRRGPHRRPSLERQTTLYDEHSHYTTDDYADARIGEMSATYSESHTGVRYLDGMTGYLYQDERYGRDDEDRQWDSGGKWYSGSNTYYENKRNRKTLPQRPASSIGIHRPEYRPTVTRQRSYDSEEINYGGQSSRRRKTLQPQQRPTSRQEGTGKKLPPTPTKPSNVVLGRKPVSLPATPGRQLPRTRTPSEEGYYKSDYNEDYNYAYRSQDNLPQDSYLDNVYGEDYDRTQVADPYAGSTQNRYTEEYDQVQDQYSTSTTYDQGYVEPHKLPTYEEDQAYPRNTREDENRQPYVQSTEIYQKSYQETYSQPSHDVRDKSREEVNEGNYQGVVYDENNGQGYEQPYKEEGYQERYGMGYTAPVTTSTYEMRNNVTGDYGRYPPESYESGYDATASADYQDAHRETYEDNYGQTSVAASQGYQQPYETQQEDYSNYRKQSYDKQRDDYANYSEQSHDKQREDYSDYRKQPYDEQRGEGYLDYREQPYDEQREDYTDYRKQSYDKQHEDYSNYRKQDEDYQDYEKDSYDKQREDYQDYRKTYDKEEEPQQQQQQHTDYKDKYEYEDYSRQRDDTYHQDSYEGSFEDKYKEQLSEQRSMSTERRKSEVPEVSVTTPRGQTKTNGYPSSESEYFYPCQDGQDVSPLGSSRRMKLGKREASPLVQQNTDSLESRDDELKDSFETAVSSVGSSQPMRRFSEYSTAGDSSPAAATLVDSPQSLAQTQAPLTVDRVAANHVAANHLQNTVVTTAMVHPTTTSNGKRLARTDSYREDTMDEEEYPEIVPKEPRRKDSQLSHQSQISQHSSTHSQKPKLTRGDSYASDHFEEEYGSPGRRDSFVQSARKDSYSSVTQDSFKTQSNRNDSYLKRDLGRQTYGQNFNAPQPISRAESYQRGYFKDQDSIDEEIVLSNAINGECKMTDEMLERYERGEEALHRGSRENSLVEPYKGTPPISRDESPRGSMTKQTSLEESVQMDTPPRSPPEPPADEELLEMVGVAPVPTQLKERAEMTPMQRWHWAYNKITMQLNGIDEILASRAVPEIAAVD